ncbi:carbohydrate-binding module family 50 protein, partial [Dothidotthia symphoricarpi CBS 119687]
QSPDLCSTTFSNTARRSQVMKPSNASSLSTNSTLRPRTRRLISVEDDAYATDGSESRRSRGGSRTASPATTSTGATSSSRLNATPGPSSLFVRSAGAQTSKATRDTSKALTGLWGNSWSAIQGLAANVLGNEGGTPEPSDTRKRRSQHGRRTSTSAPPPKQWGPAGTGSHVGAGLQEEREAMVRAMKRKDLLTANDHLMSDSIGRIKRRNSDELHSASAPPGDNDDRDALVYVHHVRPQDTLAGLSIKYNCEQAVLCKSNRMWPNDSIQTKKTIVLPVDACGVKGRPVPGPDVLPDQDLLLGEYGDSTSNKGQKPDTNGLPNGWTTPRRRDTETNSTLSSSADAEPPWKHDSWVLLPNDKTPTPIGRMPRKALGFFPPARRKSLAFSESSTPRPSVDFPRSSTSTNSPSQPTRPRASSNLSSMSAHSRQRSTSGKAWGLQGPGGVGTLGRNVRSPGPAQDGLNKMFAAHLPNMAPPPGQEYFTPWAPSLLDAGPGTSSQYGGSGAVTPLGGPGLDLQEIGGAIEGWVRKVGSQAQKLLSEPGTPGQGKRSAVPVIGAVGGDLSDLIELRDDAFEIGDDESDRGRTPTSERPRETMEQYQSARPNINLVLRERGRKGDG